MMTLYSGTTCPFSQRCRNVLYEKGMDFQIVDVDLHNKPEDLADIATISGLSPAVGQCIATAVKRATFAAPSGGGSSTMQIPVTFVQSK